MLLPIIPLSHIVTFIASNRLQALVCSAGSTGYCALKEMLQNGRPGHTLLLESGDLCYLPEEQTETDSSVKDSSCSNCRDLRASSNLSSSCCLLYDFSDVLSIRLAVFKWDHIMPSIHTITVYTNLNRLPPSLLKNGTTLTSVDLSPLSRNTNNSVILQIRHSFLAGCDGLKSLDLAPLTGVDEVNTSFLSGCSGLTSIDLTPLSKLTKIEGYFLQGCRSITALDLTPLSQVSEVHGFFLSGCSGLTTLDVSPLSKVTRVDSSFLFRCTGLKLLDMSPMVHLRSFKSTFLEGCGGVSVVDAPPQLLTSPPKGWEVVEEGGYATTTTTCGGQWKRIVSYDNSVSKPTKCILM